MYKPPENTNRVKSIKSKFEKINVDDNVVIKNGTRNNMMIPRSYLAENNVPTLNLQRQLSDPSKRNIKRTPAFRLDKNLTTDKIVPFQRGNVINKSGMYKQILNTPCDTSENITKVPYLKKNDKPILYKSKSSIDFNILRNKFNNKDELNQRKHDDECKINVSALYTEPIPKSLRIKSCDKPNNLHLYSNIDDLLLKTNTINNNCKDIDNIHNTSTLKLTDKEKNHGGIPNGKILNNKDTTLKKLDTLLELTKKQTELTDTLKIALKRPLPKGPAPEKPPRTFTHNTKQKLTISNDTRHDDISKTKRSDPKYMLNKLENALRNNKLKCKKNLDVSTTSGEDSGEDNLILKNNKNRLLPSLPDNNKIQTNGSNKLCQALNFNCINGFNCISSTTPYQQLNESKSSFFVNINKEEPVYAEPWNFDENLITINSSRIRSTSIDRNSSSKRNSLYYLSSPVLCTPRSSSSSSSMNASTKQNVPSPSVQNCSSEKNTPLDISSISSDTSESTSPIDEENKLLEDTIMNVKELIEAFENNKVNNIDSPDDINKNNITLIENKNNDIGLNETLDDLKLKIEETINNGFNDDNIQPTDNSERKLSSIDDPTINKFRNYVKNVSIYAKIKPKWKKSTLFDCCLIVEMNADVRNIKFKYPHDVQLPHKIEDLCFPEAACGPVDKTTNAQCYSLVITNDKGERTFGYCRRVVPEGSNNCLPIAYCILSKYKSPRFYKQILIELESRHGISELHRNNLLKAFYYNKFPQPGETVTIKLAETIGCSKNKIVQEKENSLEDSIESHFVIINEKGEYESLKNNKEETEFNHNLDGLCDDTGDIRLNLHHDPLYENSDLKDLHELPMDILQKIFTSLLLERKVILISCLLSKLSACVDALQAIIYPFTWPYSFIPVLPRSLWEIVESPTPIICGILSVEVINKHEIEDGIVVDLDEKCILQEVGDEDKAFCSSMLRAWRKSIAIAKTVPKDQEAHSFHLTDAYIHMFAVVLKNYRDYIVNGNFQKEAFIRSSKSRGIRRFLKWFTETTTFQTFVDTVITNSQDFSIFDKKISIYGSENSGMILDKLLDWKIN